MDIKWSPHSGILIIKLRTIDTSMLFSVPSLLLAKLHYAPQREN